MRPFSLGSNKGTDFNGTRFIQTGIRGDGQTILHATEDFTELTIKLKPLSKSDCRTLVMKFLDLRSYVVSGSVTKAWVILEYCKAKNIKYTINNNIIRRL